MEFLADTASTDHRNTLPTGADHPVSIVHREWKEMKDKKGFDADDFDEKHTAILRQYVLDSMEFMPYCIDVNKGKETTCSCLPDLVLALADSEVMDCANSLLIFGKQTKEQQQIRVMDWISHDLALENGLLGVARKVKQKRCVLPGTCNEMICRHRLASLVGYGKRKWNSCASMLKENKSPSHGLIGKPSNNGKVNYVYNSLFMAFFEELKELAVPRATRVVRNAVAEVDNVDTNANPTFRVELRDDDEDVLELPSSMSKRGIYARFLKSNLGIVQVLDAKGRVAATRPVGDDDEVPDIYPSWRSFNRYWDTHYRKLIVAKPREDVCDDCWKYANSFRFKKRTEPEGRQVSQEEAEAEQRNNEAVINQAAMHVKQAQIQRELFNEKIAEAKSSRFLPRKERTVTWVLDYAQNMALPQFGGEQPGVTYYLCPMNIYVLGIVDTVDDTLLAQVYGEDVAGKGGNCVASMLYDRVNEALVPRPSDLDKEPIKELNLVMDNCGGQNKNRMVMRLLHVIVLRNIAVRVNAIFLVKGHTKNPCDRKFNELKINTRDDNIYTPPMLFEAMNKQEAVTAKQFNSFYDWDEWETRFMKATVPKIKSFHVFTVDANYKGGFVMSRYTHNGAERDDCTMIDGENRDVASWISTKPKPLEPVGLTDIKHVELHDKWKLLVPQQHWKDFIYFAQEPTQGKRKRVTQEKQQSKKARANRQRDENTTTAQQQDQSK